VYVKLPLFYRGLQNRIKIFLSAKVSAPSMRLFKVTTSTKKIEQYQQPIKFFVTKKKSLPQPDLDSHASFPLL